VDRTRTINALAGGRIAIGVGSWLAPRLSGKLFGLDASSNPQSPYLARLFGARDIALAYGVLSTSGEAQRRWLTIGVACDLADTAAGIAAARGGYLSKLPSVMVSATALAASALGTLALREG